MVKVLFICLGNICRSPAAHGVFESLVRECKLEHEIFVDSAGTSGFHDGELPDQRMRDHARKRGLELDSLSRKLVAKDFVEFDYLVVMDESNFVNSSKLTDKEEQLEKLYRMTEFCPSFSDKEVPDPYFGGAQGFEHVLNMVTEGSRNLLDRIIKERNLV